MVNCTGIGAASSFMVHLLGPHYNRSRRLGMKTVHAPTGQPRSSSPGLHPAAAAPLLLDPLTSRWRKDFEHAPDACRQPIGGLEGSRMQIPEVFQCRGAMPDCPQGDAHAITARMSQQTGHLGGKLGDGVVADHPDRQEPE